MGWEGVDPLLVQKFGAAALRGEVSTTPSSDPNIRFQIREGFLRPSQTRRDPEKLEGHPGPTGWEVAESHSPRVACWVKFLSWGPSWETTFARQHSLPAPPCHLPPPLAAADWAAPVAEGGGGGGWGRGGGLAPQPGGQSAREPPHPEIPAALRLLLYFSNRNQNHPQDLAADSQPGIRGRSRGLRPPRTGTGSHCNTGSLV